MKACKDCGKEKDDLLFYGVQNECKECTKARVRSNYKKVGDSYDKTEHGVIRVIYKTQKRNNRIRGHGDMPYTKQDLSEWLYNNGYKEAYNSWVGSGYDVNIKPSVDRINDFKGYSFDNIRLGTWSENREHQANDITRGLGTGGKRCKKVYQYNDSNEIIGEFVSFCSAVRFIGYSIEYQLKKGIKCRNGFYWSYSKL